jgi:hypothetical protein
VVEKSNATASDNSTTNSTDSAEPIKVTVIEPESEATSATEDKEAGEESKEEAKEVPEL